MYFLSSTVLGDGEAKHYVDFVNIPLSQTLLLRIMGFAPGFRI